MQFLIRFISKHPNLPKCLSQSPISPHFKPLLSNPILLFPFSTSSGDGDNFQWNTDSIPSWSTGITKDHFDGESVGHQVPSSIGYDGGGVYESEWREKTEELEREGKKQKDVVDKWEEREWEVNSVLKQVEEPGARGSYLKDSQKSEMYRKHRQNPQLYTIERLASEYRIMRQRVHAILWLKHLEEEEERKRGEPLDDSVELLLDTFPEFFSSHDREFHVASLPYKPDFKVMPEGWDGTTRDPDEVHYDISKKEDDMLYEEFLQKFTFNTMKFENKVKVHKYARRRSSDGWEFGVEMLGNRGKRGDGGGWKFVSRPDGSTRPLNEMEKMYVKREKRRRRRKILP